MRSSAEMKRAAKQVFGRCNYVFLVAALLLITASLIASLPTYFGRAPTISQVQSLATQTSQVLSRGTAASTRDINQLLNNWIDLYGGQKNAQTFWYLTLLSELLLVGVMVLQVGLSHLALMASAGGDLKRRDFFTPLKDFGRWLALYLWMSIRIVLWSLLFVIPGIIAAYRYRQAVYLMLEDPGLGINKALRLSGKLMRGYKAHLFALDLSFILWILLESVISSLFALNFAGLYVLPYQELTRVQFYYDLRREHPVEGLAAITQLKVEQEPLAPQPPAVSAQ